MSFLCPQCGQKDSFSQDGTVAATREVDIVVKEGLVTFEYGSVDSDSWDFDSDSSSAYCECGYDLKPGEAIPTDPEDDPALPAIGDVVVCPDGLKGTVASVAGYEVEIEGWHERFKASELSIIHPIRVAA